MSKINKSVTNTLQTFLKNHKENYFIIGGHAAAYNLQLQGIEFRVTRDYDIVMVSEVDDDSFAKDLSNLLKSGEYQYGYRSSDNKQVAYRFECPKDDSYPEVIEFFVKEGAYVQSLDNRFAKLNVAYDDSKISAMILTKDVYSFAKNHVIEIHELMFEDLYGLIALKAYAYFENLELHKKKQVTSDSYKKHLRDIVKIIGALPEEDIHEIVDLPVVLKDSIKNIINVVAKSKSLLKDYSLNEQIVVGVLKTLINYTSEDVKWKY